MNTSAILACLFAVACLASAGHLGLHNGLGFGHGLHGGNGLGLGHGLHGGHGLGLGGLGHGLGLGGGLAHGFSHGHGAVVGHGLGHGYGHQDFQVNTNIAHDYQQRQKSHNPNGFISDVYQKHPYGGQSTLRHTQHTGYGVHH